MKKLIAVIMAVLFSAFNNVDYVPEEYVPYDVDSYYKVAEGDAPDYRNITRNYSDLSTGGKCYHSTIDVKDWNNDTYIMYDRSIARWWIDYDHPEVSADEISGMSNSTYTFYGRTYIVVPQMCTVQTKSTDANGHSMKLETCDGKWIFYIEGMERWFCCRDRVLDEDIDPLTYTWVHTSNVYGLKLFGGQMIGISAPGTTFTVYDAKGNKVSLAEFYAAD